MKSHLQKVDTFIFDLGNVIIDLDLSAWINDFNTLTGGEFSLEELSEEVFFKEFEIGAIAEEQVIEKVNKKFSLSLDVYSFREFWNGIMVEIPIRKLKLLKDLTNDFRTIILSNTNETHQRHFEQWIIKLMGCEIQDLVNNVYYSHHMGLRKPDPEIYLKVIEDAQISPDSTVFFDDNQSNVDSAGDCGIRSILVSHPNELWKYFYE